MEAAHVPAPPGKRLGIGPGQPHLEPRAAKRAHHAEARQPASVQHQRHRPPGRRPGFGIQRTYVGQLRQRDPRAVVPFRWMSVTPLRETCTDRAAGIGPGRAYRAGPGISADRCSIHR